MKRANVSFNYHDYLQLPEGKRYEILDGELYVVPAPSIRHQIVSLNLAAALLQHVRANRLGRVLEAPCDVVLSEENVLQPDILFVREDHAGIIGHASLQGTPDLVVEIISAGTRNKDLQIKKKVYAAFRVQEYWIVDPDAETIEVLVWSESGYAPTAVYGITDRLSSPLLPELKLPLSEIFKKE